MERGLRGFLRELCGSYFGDAIIMVGKCEESLYKLLRKCKFFTKQAATSVIHSFKMQPCQNNMGCKRFNLNYVIRHQIFFLFEALVLCAHLFR